jgi:TonB family protein
MCFRLPLTLLGLIVLASSPSGVHDPGPSKGTPATPPVTRIRLGGNDVAAKLLSQVQPVYPPLARQTRVSGTVRLHAIIGFDGTIKSLEVVSGHPLLRQASLEAVRQWRYEPTMLKGEPVEVDTTIDILFSLNERNSAPIPVGGIDPQLHGDIQLLCKVMNFRENVQKNGRKTFESFRPVLLASIPDTPSRERIADAYIEKLLATLQTDAYLERVTGLYAKYFSDSDVQQLIQFYQTPAGQHFKAIMPQFFADLSRAGQSLAMQHAPVIFKQLCTEFPELEDDPRFCKEPDSQRSSQSKAPDVVRASAPK